MPKIRDALAETTRARLRDLIARIAAEEFDYSPDADCDWCEFKTICPRHHDQVPV